MSICTKEEHEGHSQRVAQADGVRGERTFDETGCSADCCEGGIIIMSITIMGIITMGIASFRARGSSRLRCLTSVSLR